MALARVALRAYVCSVSRATFGIHGRQKFLTSTNVLRREFSPQIIHKYMSSQAHAEHENTEIAKRLESAQLLLKIEKFDKALTLFDNFVRDYPSDARGYGGRADAYQFLKQYDNAIADYKQVIRFAPKCIPALHNIALCHARLKKFSEALKDLTYLISMDSKYMPAYGTRADIYEVCGDYERAADDYMAIIRFDPSNVDALVGLGKLAMRRKDFDDAKEIYTRVLNLDPNTPSVASRLGRLEYATQVRDGKPYHENHPHIEAHRSLAIIAYQTSDWKHIIKHLDKAKDLELEAEVYKPDATSYIMRGAALYHTKESLNNAFGYLDKALKLEPNNASALFLRAAIHYENQDYDLAMDDYQNYLKILTDDHKSAADEVEIAQILLVLERIARVGRLQFQRVNKLLRRIQVKPNENPNKPKLVFQDSQAPRDPIQALFVGVAQEEVEGSDNKSRPMRKQDTKIKFYEGEEVEYDEALEHIGRMQPDAREEEKKQVFPKVKQLYAFIQQKKYDPKLQGVEFLHQSLQAILQLQEGLDALPPLMQESCLLNIKQVLDVGKKYVMPSEQQQKQ
eukprot:Phypoly_transcript_06711.p1 GENE.Phypoly_transcript_06711~~Phypoly_transcript_06711.p1  ORF type:complete len:567 (+),score=100.28 Phypoly_transcript_06711:28-1728(+)